MPLVGKRREIYQSVPTSEPKLSTSWNDETTAPRGWRRCMPQTALYMLLEAFVLISMFVLYNEWNVGRSSHVDRLQTYLALENYNKTTFFTENIDLMEKSDKADRFWSRIQATDGIVSVPTDWALELGFAPSRQSPENPEYSIYQVDVFHSLHCLHHIRNRLVSKLPLDVWPRDDVHSLHCVNFLRQQATCHGDITLQGTDDFLHFSKNNGHKCRDNDALVDWVSGWDWRGHRKWISDKYGLE